MADEPLSEQRLAEIREGLETILKLWREEHLSTFDTNFLLVMLAQFASEDAPALLAEVDRLRAETTILADVLASSDTDTVEDREELEQAYAIMKRLFKWEK